ncbi:hypothetical protein D9M72_554450 [compost metagenome]
MQITGCIIAGKFVQQRTMQTRVFGVGSNHRVHQRLNNAAQRLLVGGKKSLVAHSAEAVLKMTAPDGLDQRMLVRKVLVERADADACRLGHRIRRESGPAVLAQNASSSFDDGFDQCA